MKLVWCVKPEIGTATLSVNSYLTESANPDQYPYTDTNQDPR